MTKLLSSLGPFAPLLVLVLAAGESAAFLGLVIPGEIAVILGGVAAGAGTVPLWTMLAASVFGAVIGDSIGYSLGSAPRLNASCLRVGCFSSSGAVTAGSVLLAVVRRKALLRVVLGTN